MIGDQEIVDEFLVNSIFENDISIIMPCKTTTGILRANQNARNALSRSNIE